MAKTFASQNDLEDKLITFEELAPGAYAYTAQGDPNSGVIIGQDAVMIVDAQATPNMANDVIEKVRSITDKPIKYLVLTHYHAVRVLGASAYNAELIISSNKTLEMIKERGKQDWLSEFQRFPRLFKGHDSIPGLTWPQLTFDEKIYLDLGNLCVEVMHLGEGHTRGDTVVWLPSEKVLYAGDLVEYKATPYCGDAQLLSWPKTLTALSKLKANALVPGRGDALKTPAESQEAINMTKHFVITLTDSVQRCINKGLNLNLTYKLLMEEMRPEFGNWVIFEHCMCFNVSRAYEELKGTVHPSIWTEEKDIAMWNQLNTK